MPMLALKAAFLLLAAPINLDIIQVLTDEVNVRRQKVDAYIPVADNFLNNQFNILYQLEWQDPIIFSLKPNEVGNLPFGDPGSQKTFPYQSNSRGLRAPDYGPKPPLTQRIVFLGDSVLFGWALETPLQAYPAVAQGLLNQIPGFPDIECINAGAPGNDSMTEAEHLKRLTEWYDPDIVVLGFTPEDAEPPEIVPLPPSNVYHFANLWSWEDMKDSYNRQNPGEPKLPVAVNLFNPDYTAGFAPDSPKWRAARRALGQIRDFCAARNIPFLIVMPPDFYYDYSLNVPYNWEPIRQAVNSWGPQLGVQILDLFPVFQGMPASQTRIPEDGHPTPYAHAIMGQKVADALVSLIRLKNTAVRHDCWMLYL